MGQWSFSRRDISVLRSRYLSRSVFVGLLEGQGQRTLTSLRSKDLHQEVVVPAGNLGFAFDAVFRRVLF